MLREMKNLPLLFETGQFKFEMVHKDRMGMGRGTKGGKKSPGCRYIYETREREKDDTLTEGETRKE